MSLVVAEVCTEIYLKPVVGVVGVLVFGGDRFILCGAGLWMAGEAVATHFSGSDFFQMVGVEFNNLAFI